MRKIKEIIKKTQAERYLQSTIRVGVMIMFILFSVGFVSAWEFGGLTCSI